MDVVTDSDPDGALAAWFRSKELSGLLRSRRRRVPVPPELRGPARRFGLTQADAAALLGVSERYYQDLEHGRLRHPKPGLLEEVSALLQLGSAEREVFYHLAAGHPPARRPSRADLELLQEWIDSVPGQPTLVTDLAWNILAWNRVEPLLQDPATGTQGERNAILWLFTDTAKQRFVDLEAEYPVLVGRVRTAYLCAQCADPALNRLVERLLRIPEAAYWWRRGVLHSEPVIQTRRSRRPDGTIRQVRSIATTIPDQALRLIVFTPADTAPSTAPRP